MYGLAFKGAQETIVKLYGQDKWEEILKRAPTIPKDGFISGDTYPEEYAFTIFGVASEVLSVPVPELLRQFGTDWPGYTSSQGFESLLKMAGSTLPELLKNLDALHVQVASTMPQLVAPEFEVTDETPNSLHLHYRSKRPGLTPVVLGNLQALAERFNLNIEAKLVASKMDGADHDIFLVNYSPKTPGQA